MKNRIYLIIIAILFPCFVIAQGLDDLKVSRSGGTTTVSNSSGSVTISNRDIWSGSGSSSSSSSSNDRDRTDYNNERREREKREREEKWEREWAEERRREQAEEWAESERRERERMEREERERREREVKEERERMAASSLLNEMHKLHYNDCIDILQIQITIDEFEKLSDYQKEFLGNEGHNARAKLLAQKHNMTPIYNKYSLMATNIRNLSFEGFNTRLLCLSYEDLDKYLKQFLNKHDFERAKVEYKKYEKAKVLENEIEELYAHLDDKKYLRENYDNVENKMVGVKLLYGLNYVNNLNKLTEIKKVVEYDEIKQIPLTITNIKTTLASKKATKNNADWKEISKGMTSQRLLAVLGTLNSENDNILPDFVKEKSGYYLFEGKPTETDTKVVTKEYLVSKDGSEIKIFETEGVIANDLVEIKATLGDKKASTKLTLDGEVENKVGSTVAKNAAGAKLTLMNTDWHKQDKKTVYSIDTDGSILQNGEERSVGLKANISGSANADINIPIGKKVNNSGSANTDNDVHNDKTPIVSGNATVGPEVEAAHISRTLAGKWTPKMIVNPDGSISYRQYSASVELGASAGASAKFSASKKGVNAKAGLGLSAGVSFDSQDIDGALKQIDSDVVLRIIKSSIDNDYYKSDFDDEAIVSSIRKEVENY